MVHRIINDIEMPRFLWKQMSKVKRINPNLAFDTETVNGRCFLIADSNGRTFNDKEFIDLKGLLQFLNTQSYRNTNNWFYNLEYDTNAIIHFLSFEDRQFIAEYNYIDYEGYRIEIIPHKELKISVIKNEKLLHTTAFYDLAQFYNFKKLETLAKTTQYDKVYVADISAINKDKYYSDETYHILINDRCVIDCKIAYVKANELTANINKLVGVNQYKSKASIARRYVLENLTKNLQMPSIKLLDCALQAYHAGHIETCQIGLFTNIHNYDIKSAYPAVIANLYETSGAYKHNREYEPDSAYSFYLISIDYQNEYLSPMWFLKANANYHATGTFNSWVAQSELEYLIETGQDFRIIKAYHILKDSYTEKPFYNLINDLYKARLEAKNDNNTEKRELEQVYKIILNSIYGVTLNTINKKVLADYETDLYEIREGKLIFFETQYKATNMYNPVYGCDITARTRSKIFTDFGKQAKEIVAINTDGVYMTKKSHVKLSDRLGDYGYKNMQKIMFLGSGRYFLFNNNSNTVDDGESRFRGTPLRTSDIYNLMGQHKSDNKLTLSREKPIKLKESIKNSTHYKIIFGTFPLQQCNVTDNFNVFKKVTQDIKFINHRRFWYDEMHTISDLWENQYTSRPFDVGEIK